MLGVDVCLNSLQLAQRFKHEHGLDRAAFAQMNLFRPALKDGFFDVVISNGVLHHTADCRLAFQRISRLAQARGLRGRWAVQRLQPPAALCPAYAVPRGRV